MASYHRDDVLEAFGATGGELKDETLEKLDELDLQRKGLSAEPEPEPYDSIEFIQPSFRHEEEEARAKLEQRARAGDKRAAKMLTEYKWFEEVETIPASRRDGGALVTRPGVVLGSVVKDGRKFKPADTTKIQANLRTRDVTAAGNYAEKNWHEFIAAWSKPWSNPEKKFHPGDINAQDHETGPYVLENTVRPLPRVAKMPRENKMPEVEMKKQHYEKLGGQSFIFAAPHEGEKTKLKEYIPYEFDADDVSHLTLKTKGDKTSVGTDTTVPFGDWRRANKRDKLQQDKGKSTITLWVLKQAINPAYLEPPFFAIRAAADRSPRSPRKKTTRRQRSRRRPRRPRRTTRTKRTKMKPKRKSK